MAMSDSDTPASGSRDRPEVPPDTSLVRSSEPSGSGPSPPVAAPPRRRHGGWQWTGAVVVLLVAALLTTLSVVARYARDEIINTDQYVATVTPLASDPAVQNAVANRVSNEVIQKLDVPKLIHDLAEATGRPNADAIASAIAGPVNDAVEGFVHKTVLTFVQSPEFEKLWVSANTKAHTQLSAVLTGEGTDVVKTQGNQIIVEVGPIVDQVKQELIDSGLSVASKIPTVSVQVPVMTVENLPAIQSYVNLLDNLATWLPIAALLLLALGIWLAPLHRRAALIGAMMVAILMIIMLVALSILRDTYANQVANKGLNEPAALALYDTLLRFLVQAVEALLVVSIVAAVWLWLAGPGPVGTFLRRWGRRGEEWIANRINRTSLRFGPVPHFTARYGRWIVAVVGVMAAYGLLRSPTIGTAVWLSIGVLFVMIIVGILARLHSAETSGKAA
jgi:hypothetical protein